MVYRDPKTGTVFDPLDPRFIPLYGNYEIEPDEAARLMGFEVIEDPPTVNGDTPTEEDNMDKPDKAVHWKIGDKAVTSTDELVKEKPRLAEVLGWKWEKSLSFAKVQLITRA